MPTPMNWDGQPICTPADVRRHLQGIPLGPINLDDSDPDALFRCRVASKEAVNYCQRIFEPLKYENEKYAGSGRPALIQLRNYPVQSVESIKVWNRLRTDFREYTEADRDVRFVLEENTGEIEIIPNAVDWLLAYQSTEYDTMFATVGVPLGRWNVEVTYRGGFSDGYPIDLVDAVAALAADRILDEVGASKTEGVNSFSSDGVSVSFGNGGEIYSSRKQMLYKRWTRTLDLYKRKLVGGI